MDAVAIKQSNNSDDFCLVTICYFRNTFPGSIFSLVLYLAGNNILDGIDLIQLGIDLQWIPIECTEE